MSTSNVLMTELLSFYLCFFFFNLWRLQALGLWSNSLSDQSVSNECPMRHMPMVGSYGHVSACDDDDRQMVDPVTYQKHSKSALLSVSKNRFSDSSV